MRQDWLLETLQAQDFDVLEKHLTPLHMAFEAGQLSEQDYDDAVSLAMPCRIELIDVSRRWCAAYPDSFIAHAFTGAAVIGLAWEARTNLPSYRITARQSQLMQTHFAEAEDYLLKACGMTTKPHLALLSGMYIQGAIGDVRTSPTWHERIEALLPSSVMLSASWMWQLNPKWSGSEEALDAFMALCRTRFTGDALAWVESSYCAEKADICLWSQQYTQALEWLDKADQHKRDIRHDELRATCYDRLGQPKKATELLAQLITQKPTRDRLFSLGQNVEWDFDGKGWGNIANADHYYAKGYAMGSGTCAARYVALMRNVGVHQGNFDEAKTWCERGIALYCGEAHYHLSCLYFNGDGTPKNIKQAMEHWTAGAHLGSADCAHNATAWYWDGRDGIKRDYKAAFDMARLGAQVDSAYCAGAAGRMILNGQVKPAEYGLTLEDGIDYLEEGANGNDGEAIEDMIRRLWTGKGTEKDRDGAKEWLGILRNSDPARAKTLEAELNSLGSKFMGLFGR